MNYANPQEHVPEAERNNRVIKERFCAAFHRLPFKKMPKIMVKYEQWKVQRNKTSFHQKGEFLLIIVPE